MGANFAIPVLASILILSLGVTQQAFAVDFDGDGIDDVIIGDLDDDGNIEVDDNGGSNVQSITVETNTAKDQINVTSNTADENIKVDKNMADAIDVTDNDAGKKLECKDNIPDPSGSGNDADEGFDGQCTSGAF